MLEKENVLRKKHLRRHIPEPTYGRLKKNGEPARDRTSY